MRAAMMWMALAACGGGDPTDSSDATDLTDATDVTDDTDVGGDLPQVLIETSLGEMVVEIDVEQAPITGENFLAYVDAGFYDGDDGLGGTIFHRVIDEFMIQGGGFTATGSRKVTNAPITLETDTGLNNVRGTLAMARTNDPDSATTQFFVNHVDNGFLDSTGPGTGYAVFGRVVVGLDVLDAIATTPVDNPGGQSPKPLTDVVILDCERVE